MKTSFAIVLYCIFSSLIFADHAIVIKMRGKVTALPPKSMIAKILKIGDKLPEDTSVLTGKKSFALIRFSDSSTMSIGPNSKVVVQKVSKKKASIISLLKGKVRTKVKKSNAKSSKNKFYLRTRTAAMGVRGTEFQTVFNPENKATSMVTFSGEVAMAKVEEAGEETLKNNKIAISRDDITNKIKVKKSKATLSNRRLLDSALSSKNAVVVKTGQFSGSFSKLPKTTMPVKISPVQLNTLYKSENFGVEDREKAKEKGIDKIVKSETKLVAAEQAAPLEGLHDVKKGLYAPKAGGVLDFKTGLYVAPEKSSVYDAKNKIYLPKLIGKIDSSTGDYIPPKGIKLTANKGFVIAANTKKPKRKLRGLQSVLNKVLKKDIILKGKIPENQFYQYSYRELLGKDIARFEISGFDSSLRTTNVSGQNLYSNGTKTTSEGAKSLVLSWYHSSGMNFQPITGFKYSSIDYGYSGYMTQSTRSLYSLSLGGRYYLSPSLFIKSLFLFEQLFYINDGTSSTSSNNGSYDRVTRKGLYLGLDVEFLKRKRFSLLSSLGGIILKDKTSGDLKIKTDLGFYISGGVKYAWNKKTFSDLSIFVRNLSGEFSGSGYSFDQKVSENGLKLSYSYIF